jgi:hypothetical protein
MPTFYCIVLSVLFFFSSSVRAYLAFEMSTTVEKSSRKRHPEQEKLFVELLSLPDYKPIGGSGDGVMERKQDTRWAPLLARFSLENEVLVAGQRKTASGLGFKEVFNIKKLISKYKSLREKYMSLKRDFKVNLHQVSGETGAAADGQPATAQAAIDAATEAWLLFAAFHSAFGSVQRLRADTWECTASPFPKPATAQANQPPVSPQALQPPTTKPVLHRFTVLRIVIELVVDCHDQVTRVRVRSRFPAQALPSEPLEVPQVHRLFADGVIVPRIIQCTFNVGIVAQKMAWVKFVGVMMVSTRRPVEFGQRKQPIVAVTIHEGKLMHSICAAVFVCARAQARTCVRKPR